jgi:hypothetical protein
MSISAAAIALGFAGTVAAAPSTHPAPKRTDAPSSKSKAPKLSKWQQHVLEVLKNAAPGDEYFGRMKMSYLGINNTFHDDAIRAGAYTTDERLIAHAAWADEALNAWAKKYPNDPQLSRSYFLAFLYYRKVWTQDGQQKAWNYANLELHKFPNSFFGKTLKADLARGFTEHYFASPEPCAMGPAPSGSPSASPLPSSSPTATPSPAPGQPKVEILPVPCFTPSPSPSPIPSGSLSPQPSSSASASPSPTPTATHRP